MEMYAIGIWYDENKKVAGLRIIDIDTGESINAHKENIVNSLKSGKVKIENVVCADGVLRGNGMKLSELHDINNLNYARDTKLIAIRQTNRKVALCNAYGEIRAFNKKVLTKDTVSNILNYDAITDKFNCKIADIDKDVKQNSFGRMARLEKEVDDENVVWTLRDFKCYMKNKGYEYTLERYSRGNYAISDVTDECKVLHLPIEVTTIKNLFKNYNGKGGRRNIAKVIFGSKTDEIKCYVSNRNHLTAENGLNLSVSIDIIHFQKGKEKIDSCNIDGLSHLKAIRANLPYTKRCSHAYRCCIIDNLIADNADEIYDSFDLSKINNLYINAKKINECYYHIRENLLSTFGMLRINGVIRGEVTKAQYMKVKKAGINNLILGDKVLEINKSFVGMHRLSKVNFDRSKRLNTIWSSFNNLEKHPSELKIGNGDEKLEIIGSFNDWDIDLEDVGNKKDVVTGNLYGKDLFINVDEDGTVVKLGNNIKTIDVSFSGISNNPVIIPNSVESFVMGKQYADTRFILDGYTEINVDSLKRYDEHIINRYNDYNTKYEKAGGFYNILENYVFPKFMIRGKEVTIKSSNKPELGQLSFPIMTATFDVEKLTLEKGVLANTRMEYFDTVRIEKESVLRDKLLADNEELEQVVIGDNIVELGNDVFSNCSMLSRVAISKNVKKMRLKSFGKSPVLAKATEVWVYRNSYADKVLSASDKVILKYIDDIGFDGNISDLFYFIANKKKYTENKITEAKKRKYIAILAETKYERLLNDMEHIEDIYGIISDYEFKITRDGGTYSNPLHTEKLKSISIDGLKIKLAVDEIYRTIDKLKDYFLSGEMVPQQFNQEINKFNIAGLNSDREYSEKYINILNYITSTTIEYPELYNIETLNKLYKYTSMGKVVYIDLNSVILCFNIRTNVSRMTKTYYDNIEESVGGLVLVVAIHNKNIEYATLLDYDTLAEITRPVILKDKGILSDIEYKKLAFVCNYSIYDILDERHYNRATFAIGNDKAHMEAFNDHKKRVTDLRGLKNILDGDTFTIITKEQCNRSNMKGVYTNMFTSGIFGSPFRYTIEGDKYISSSYIDSYDDYRATIKGCLNDEETTGGELITFKQMYKDYFSTPGNVRLLAYKDSNSEGEVHSMRIWFMDAISGRVIDANLKLLSSFKMVINNIYENIDDFMLKEANNCVVKSINELNNPKKVRLRLDLILNGYTPSTKDSNFDLEENTEIKELVTLIDTSGVTGLSELNIKVLEYLEKVKLIEKVNIKQTTLDKFESRSTFFDTTSGAEVQAFRIDGEYNNFVYITAYKTKDGKKDVYKSYGELGRWLFKLNYISKKHKDWVNSHTGEKIPQGCIDFNYLDENYEVLEFLDVKSRGKNKQSLEYSLYKYAIDIRNFNLYLVYGGEEREDNLKILRINDIETSNKIANELLANEYEYLSLSMQTQNEAKVARVVYNYKKDAKYKDLLNIDYGILTNRSIKNLESIIAGASDTELNLMRQYVLKGYGKDYNYTGYLSEIFRGLSKQKG